MIRVPALASLALALLSPSSWASGLSLGFEANSVFSQPMALVAAPVLTRIRTDNRTSLTTFRTMSYFSRTDLVDASTSAATVVMASTTYVKSWDNIAWSGHYAFLKLGYSTEFFEGSAKIGAATKSLTVKETWLELSTGAVRDWNKSGVTEYALVDMDKGFAYGFEVRGQPYDGENFLVMASLKFDHAFNTVETGRSVSLDVSTNGAVMGQTSTEVTHDVSHMRYGLTVAAAAKFEHFIPYLGFDYMMGRFAMTTKTVTTSSAYNLAGAMTSGTTTTEELTYTLKPKSPIGAVLGFTLPFERGGVTFEGRLKGDMSLKVSGFVGF